MIITEFDGKIEFENLIDGITYREESDEQTGYKEKVIIDTRERSLTPAILVKGKA